MQSLIPYTVLLSAPSPLFDYFPYRDSDVSVGWNASYTHSTTWPDRAQPTTNVSALGTPYRRTRLNGASVSLLFEGTGLFICFTSGGASYTVTLDSVSEASISSSVDGTPCEQSGAQAIFRADNLSMSSHNATIVLTSTPPNDADFSFFGGGITLGLNTEGYAVDNTSIIDDQDPNWALEPSRHPRFSWDTDAKPWYFDHTVTFDCVYGPQFTASYTFNNSVGVVLTGSIGRDNHAFSITLDNTPFNLDATSSWEDGSTIFFAKANLDPSTAHRLTVTNYNTAQPDCPSVDEMGQPVDRYCCVAIDSLQLLKASTTERFQPHMPRSTGPATGTPTGTALISSFPTAAVNSANGTHSTHSVAAILGGAIGGFCAGLAIVGTTICVLIRRRRRVQEQLDRSVAVEAQYHPDLRATWGGRRARSNAPDETRESNADGTSNGSSPPISMGGNGATETRPRLTQEDLLRVLDYVASRKGR